MSWLKLTPETQSIKDPVKFLYNKHLEGFSEDGKRKSDKKEFASNKFAVAKKAAKAIEILEINGPKFGKSITMLDYGCGDGTESLAIRDYLVKSGIEVKLIQCDIKDLRTLSPEEKKSITFIKSDEFDFRKHKIDFAVLLNVLHHLGSGCALNSLETVIDGLQEVPVILIREHDVVPVSSETNRKEKQNQAVVYYQHILYEIHETDRMSLDEFRKFVAEYPKKFAFIPRSDLNLLFINHKIQVRREKRYDFRYHALLTR